MINFLIATINNRYQPIDLTRTYFIIMNWNFIFI